MFIAISRFRVNNGKQAEVHDAFVNRPRLVEDAPGFRGLEVYRDAQDESAFLLLTRWADEASFVSWHRSPAHGAAHTHLPSGLKLDPSHTELVTAQRVDGATSLAADGERLLDLALPLARALAASQSIHVLETAANGRVIRANDAFDTALGRSAVSQHVDELLDSGSREVFHACAARGDAAPVLLHFVNANGNPVSLRCQITARDGGLVLIGEPPWKDHRVLEAELNSINGSLAALTRENARRARELAEANEKLEHAYAQLRDAHWHLEKISDVLPICMECRKVRTGAGEDSWEAVEAYLQRSSTFLSHGYCSRCTERLLPPSDPRELG